MTPRVKDNYKQEILEEETSVEACLLAEQEACGTDCSDQEVLVSGELFAGGDDAGAGAENYNQTPRGASSVSEM